LNDEPLIVARAALSAYTAWRNSESLVSRPGSLVLLLLLLLLWLGLYLVNSHILPFGLHHLRIHGRSGAVDLVGSGNLGGLGSGREGKFLGAAILEGGDVLGCDGQRCRWAAEHFLVVALG